MRQGFPTSKSGAPPKPWYVYALAALFGLAALLAVLIFGIGYLLPEEDSITRSVVISKPPEAIWPLVGNFAAQSAWRPQLRSMERLPDQDGHETWRITDQYGESMTMLVMDSAPPQRLVCRFLDPRASGDITWEIDVVPIANDSRVKLIQSTRLSSPQYRFLFKYVFGTKFTDDYLEALARKFGDPPVVQ